ncbi:MAG: hypothetical protein AAF517_09580 [Planctomycetota bacterium]
MFRVTLLSSGFLVAIAVAAYVIDRSEPAQASLEPETKAPVREAKLREPEPEIHYAVTPAVADVTEGPGSDDEELIEEEIPVVEGGPLAESGWFFAWAAFNERDQSESFILLQRQIRNKNVDKLSFKLRELRIRDDERDLDFIVLSADRKGLVYFMTENPGLHYRLRRR